MQVSGFDHIVLCVRDVERTVAFYRQVLSMEPREERPGKWSLHFGANKISLQDVTSAPEIARGTTAGSGNFCVLTTEPMDGIVASLAKHDVPVVLGPGERDGAIGRIESVYFHDPDGNLVEVARLVDAPGSGVAPSELTPFELFGMQPVLAVPDVEETVAYYRDQLGFHVDFVEGDPPVHARVVADPTYAAPTIHIRFEPLRAGRAPETSGYLWLHVARRLDELFERYEARGVEIVEAPSDRPWGLRQFTIRDCNGTRATFCSEIVGN